MRIGQAEAAAAVDRRQAAGAALAEAAGDIATACHGMATRFHAGATLFVFGTGSSATDAAHIAVEFMHPVIVGKRALPAMSLTNDVVTLTGVASHAGFEQIFSTQLALRARPRDIALGLSADGRSRSVLRGLEQAHEQGLLTVAMTGGDAGEIARSAAVDHRLVARSDDPLIVKEIQVTTYHILWELVHVFLEHDGPLDAEVSR